MTRKIAINGFGRIGRGVLRCLLESDAPTLEVVAINDLAAPAALAHLLEFDSVHGRLRAPIVTRGDILSVNGKAIRLTRERDPERMRWQGVDVAFECTGHFTSRAHAARHLENGAKRVLVSAPGTDLDRTVVHGVNDGALRRNDVIVSNASCTTNCLAPVAMVLDREFGIETGYMTTVHAYTGDQPTHDSDHRDPYRARAAALSMVPTSTGAAHAIAEVLPQLAGRLEGSAIRVPTPNVSMVDFCFLPKRAADKAEINAALREASEGALRGILSYEEKPMVSVDFNHDPHSSCFAPGLTAVTAGGLVRVVSWYDNEWGFANRMIDTGGTLANLADPLSVHAHPPRRAAPAVLARAAG